MKMRFSWFAKGVAKEGLEHVPRLFGRDTSVVSGFSNGLKRGVTVFSPPQCTVRANREINEKVEDNQNEDNSPASGAGI
jgi:hypothetical protein